MKKLITSLAAVATLGLGVSACGNNNTVHLTPQPTAQKYVQIERLSRPAIKEVFEPFQDHQKSNAVEPYADATIQGDIKATEDALRPPNATAGTDYGATLASVLYPDEYTVNLAGGAPAGADPYYFLSEIADKGAFGGRAPNDDVIYLELNALFGPLLSELGAIKDDNEEDTCLMSQNLNPAGQGKPGGQNAKKLTSTTFPYLATPS
ncbi:MAG: DUF4331 family protein [Candidatus Eremiobacteraeota bacterium]|nr:DUF4331 family protein [Candidatus Eremiobacteraeota bacterium]